MKNNGDCGCGGGKSESNDIKRELLRRIKGLKGSSRTALPEPPRNDGAPTVMTDLRVRGPGGETINPV